MILALNAGSSSLKFGVYRLDEKSSGAGHLVAEGLISRIGFSDASARIARVDEPAEVVSLPGHDHDRAAGFVLRWLDERDLLHGLRAVGHRVVHGGELTDHSLIDDRVQSAIERAASFAPIHNPPALAVIRHARQWFDPPVPMVGVFDTSFFAKLPSRAKYYAIPWILSERHGIRRFGFHGLAHEWMLMRGAQMLGRRPGDTTLITLQLGNGCSAAVIRSGHAVDTTMGMTPLEGLMMGTRSGSIDPALVDFMAEREEMTAAQVTALLNDESGLLGVSGVSSDVRDVSAAAEDGDERAALALEMFCYRVKKQIGAYMAVAGPVDAVVFGGGIGEHSHSIRWRVCDDLQHLGVQIDLDASQSHDGGDADISDAAARVRSLVVEVDELRIIAETTASLTERAH